MVGLLASGFFVTIYCSQHSEFYNWTMSAQGIPYVPRPFSDMSAVVQASFCAHRGVNVYISSPCMGGGVYNYSPLLLRIPFLNLIGSYRLSSGLILAGIFFICLSCLPSPRSVTELICRAAASVSSSVIFALERANFDVVIFLAVLLGLLFYLRNFFFRLVAYGLFLFVGAIKFFPLTLGILIIRESIKLVSLLALIIGLTVLVFMIHYFRETLAAIEIIPRFGPLGMDFGAVNVPFGLSLILDPPAHVIDATIASYRMPEAAKTLYYIMIFASALFAFRRERTYRTLLAKTDNASLAFLIAGAVLIVTCFYLAQNVMYRAIFLLFLLPALFGMRNTESSLCRRRLDVLVAAILFLMWEEFFRTMVIRFAPGIFGRMPSFSLDILFWMLREGVWWWVVVQLFAFILCYVYLSVERWRVPRKALNYS